jgi:type I site-specific restriction endonuclease
LDKKKLSEADICEKSITLAMQLAAWDTVGQIYREYTLHPFRVVVRGHKVSCDKRSGRRADNVLFCKSKILLIVLESKYNNHSVSAQPESARQYPATPAARLWRRRPRGCDHQQPVIWLRARAGYRKPLPGRRSHKGSCGPVSGAHQTPAKKVGLWQPSGTRRHAVH